MAPSSPRRKTGIKTNAQRTTGVAAPTAKNAQATAAAAAAAMPAVDYAQEQDNEILSLSSIYLDDFQEDAVNPGAWGKTVDRSFRLKIKPSESDHRKPNDFIVLSVILTATYPRSAPVLEVDGLDKFHERTQKRIQNLIHLTPDQMGDPIIFQLTMEIQEALDDAVDARATGALPSLQEERASAEEAALTQAKEAEANQARIQQETQQEAQRNLNEQVKEALSRGEKRKSLKTPDESSKQSAGQNTQEIVTFDHSAMVKVGNDTESFNKVVVNGVLFDGVKEKVYLGKPKVSNATKSAFVTIVKRKVERGRVVALEPSLEKARTLPEHTSLVKLLAFRVDRIDDASSEVVFCREYADRGSLYDLLSFGDLHTNKARQFTVQLLEGLEFLHQNNIFHGAIDTRRIYLSNSPSLAPKLADFGYATHLGLRHSDLPYKWRSQDEDSEPSQHCDLWDLGVVIVQMFLGLSATDLYPSPSALFSKLELSEAFKDFLAKIFLSNSKQRPSCFDLLPVEFLRTNASVLSESPSQRTRKSSSGVASPLHRRSRHNSSSLHEQVSRFEIDFTELGRLGQGAFGKVVKARHKFDGGLYAVKLIKQAPELLEKVLKEVMLLRRLNHPYVVRYYSTWVENDGPGSLLQPEEALSATEDSLSQSGDIEFAYSNPLDFVSSDAVQFEGSDEETDDDEHARDDIQWPKDSDNEDDEDDPFERNSETNVVAEASSDDPFEHAGNGNGMDGASTAASDDTSRAEGLRRNNSRSDSHRMVSTLYIQMELCDRRSLRNLIIKGMGEDDSWRILRQITEGLSHIHEHRIIHRDLKPENIFIDNTGIPKIGDFGLATAGHYNHTPAPTGSANYGSERKSKSIGTALYMAPELESKSDLRYDDRVDMYSLGIVFFEMCQSFNTAMERIMEIRKIRQKHHQLPATFQANSEKAAQGKLITCLISHKPSERFTSAQLLRSDLLPLKMEDETIKRALEGLSDPNSPYHQQLLSALFAHDGARRQQQQQVKAGAWQAKSASVPDNVDQVRVRGLARYALQTVFRRHGGEESRRDAILPRSELYTREKVVQVLDASGTLLQMPYDMTLPHAQQLARQTASVRCTFTFGGAYRDTFPGEPPRVSEEVDFDIVNSGRDETALNDAEVVKVMDEVVAELPTFDTLGNICFHLSHDKLLDAVLDHCRVPTDLRPAAKETLSKIRVSPNTWKKWRPELRKIGLSDSTLDDLCQFNWRDEPDNAFARLRSVFDSSQAQTKFKSDEGMEHLRKILGFTQKFGLKHKPLVAPLSCMNARYYANGMLFLCTLEIKKSASVVAAGGRYDDLIQSHRPPDTTVPRQGAVGLTIGMDNIVANLLKNCPPQSKSSYLKEPGDRHEFPKRCEVLVIIPNGTESLRDAGLSLVARLWANDISAELSHSSFPEQNYTFVITMKHESSTSVRVTNNTNDTDDVDVQIGSPLISLLHGTLRDLASNKFRRPLLRNQSSHQGGDRKNNIIQVLTAKHGSKKGNKYAKVEGAAQRWSEKLDQIKDAPILAIETRDDVLDLIQTTRLSDGESWRKAREDAPSNERNYVYEIRDMLDTWKTKWMLGEGVREVCVYNFRTQRCIYYDLGM